MNAKTRRPVLLLAGKPQGSSRSRKAGVGRPRALPARRPPAKHHAWTQVAEPSCRRCRGSADNSGRTSPASEPPASLPASIAVIRAGMEFTGVETRPPRSPGMAGPGADLCPLPGRVKMRARADGRHIISGAGSAAVGAAPARRRQGRSARPPPIASQACRAACFQACARRLTSGMRAPPDARRARAGRALGMCARKHRRA